MDSGIDDTIGSMSDGVTIGGVGEQITLPDGRTVIVTGVPDSVIGPEPTPPDPPLHRDVYFTTSDGQLVLSSVIYTELPSHSEGEDPGNYLVSLPHTTNCQDYIPS